MIFIPELQLKKILEGMLTYIRIDWNDHSDKSETFLYKMYYGQVDGKLDYYTAAQKLFLTDPSDPTAIVIRKIYDADRAKLPTIHMNLPSMSKSEEDTVGMGLEEELIGGNVFSTYLRNFDVNYNFLITSSNEDEVLIIHYTLLSLLTLFMPSIELMGFSHIKIGAADLQLHPDLVPLNIYMKAVTFSSNFGLLIPVAFPGQEITRLIFTGNNSNENVIVTP